MGAKEPTPAPKGPRPPASPAPPPAKRYGPPSQCWHCGSYHESIAYTCRECGRPISQVRTLPVETVSHANRIKQDDHS